MALLLLYVSEMKTLVYCITVRCRFWLSVFALLSLSFWPRNAGAQTTPVSDYATLSAILAAQSTGNVSVTNFVSNSVVSVQTLGETMQITGNVTIDGTVNNIVIDGGNSNQLFNVHTNALLVLKNLQLMHGLGTNGGAIYNAGTLVVSNCVFGGNLASNLSGVNGLNATTNSTTNGTPASAGRQAMGGAIYSLGPLSVYYSAFLTNRVIAGTGGTGGSGANSTSFGTTGGSGGAGGDAFGGAIFGMGASNVFFAAEFIGNSCVAGNGGNGGSAGTLIGVVPVVDENGDTGQGAGGGAAAGAGVYLTGTLWMSNCLFYDNLAVAGSAGVAELNNVGTGYNGIDGAPAGGGGLYLSNSVPAAYVVNSIFYENQCNGGNGGSASGSSTTAGSGGTAEGGAIFSGAVNLTVVNCTLATNLLYGGLGATDFGTNGLEGADGTTNGGQIYQFTGAAHMANSIVAGGSGDNVIGVTDEGYNLSSDATPAKATPYTRLNTAPGLDSSLSSDGGPLLGPLVNGDGIALQTLTLLANGPATNAIPGVPGLTFPALDERLMPRGTPASIGAFENHIITTNTTSPATITLEPTDDPTAKLGQPAYFMVGATPSPQDSNPLGYQWQLNGVNLTDNANFSGTATPTLTIKDVTEADLGQYQVFVSPTLLDSVATSSNVYLLVDIATTIKAQPVSHLNVPVGSVVNLSINVGGSPPFFYQWESNGVPLTDGNEFSGVATSNLTINPVNLDDAASYSVVVSTYFHTNTSAAAKLTVVPDKTKPTVTITSPAAGARTTDTVISGTATDNAQVTGVSIWVTNIFNGVTNLINISPILSTNSPTSKTWTTPANAFPAGSNTVVAQSVDYSGNLSPVVVRKFFYIVPSTFTLSYNENYGTVTGSASVAGNTAPANGAQLNLGEGYTLVAKPAVNYLLTNWTSSTGWVSNSTTLHFIMTPDLVIEANFVPSPFLPVAGIYNGLIFETNDAGPAEQTTGFLSHLTLGNLGAYSGTLWLAGTSYSLSGTFDIFGQASNHIARPVSRGGPVSVVMNVQWTNSQIIGSVTGTNDGGWISSLDAEEAAGTGVSGQSTLLLSPSADAIGAIPPGDGYLLMSNHLGTVVIAGALPDGSTFSQSVPLGKLGDVPIFANLYADTGVILGLVKLTNGTPQAEANFVWIKPEVKTGIYNGGFTNLLSAQGSAWNNKSSLSGDTGTLTISNSTLNLSYQVSIVGNTVTATSGSANSLRGTVNPNTGAITFVFGNGVGKATDTGYAAVLQNTGAGGGYFVTKTDAGAISLTLTAPGLGGGDIDEGSSSSESTYSTAPILFPGDNGP